jgi:hypothetical protein
MLFRAAKAIQRRLKAHFLIVQAYFGRLIPYFGRLGAYFGRLELYRAYSSSLLWIALTIKK